jgi:hypothetical protein
VTLKGSAVVASMEFRGVLGGNRFNLVLDSDSSPPDTRTTTRLLLNSQPGLPRVWERQGGEEKNKNMLNTYMNEPPLKLLTAEGESGSNRQA